MLLRVLLAALSPTESSACRLMSCSHWCSCSPRWKPRPCSASSSGERSGCSSADVAHEGNLSLAAVIAAAVAGAVIGDNIGFVLGRRYGEGLT
jgi:hypothetical protein